MSLGENIYNKRKEMRLTQEELAEKMKVSRQTISDWERDVKQPELRNLTKLAKLLNASLDNLLADELSDTQDFLDNALTDGKTLKISSAVQTFAEVLKSATSDIYITDEEDKE